MAGRHREFPTSPKEFEADERISWSEPDDKFVLEETNGNEWEFDEKLKRWVPMVDDRLLEQQGKAYRVAGVDESEDVKHQIKSKKRKKNDDADGGGADKPAAKKQNTTANCAVYATNIPLNATLDDIDTVFTKCGIISDSVDSEEKRIKMYTDDQGNFKGEALIVYFRPESVRLAIDMLDDTYLLNSDSSRRMRVQAADMSFKKQVDNVTGDDRTKDLPDKQRPDPHKLEARRKRMINKLSDWGDDDGYEPATAATADNAGSRWDRTVVLKHMFTLIELEEDPDAEDDIQADILEEGQKFGEVDKVFVFNQEPQGVACIKFIDRASAQRCAKSFNGRKFDGRTVVAYVADGSEIFKRVNRHDEAREQARLEQFGRDLQSGALAKDI